MILSKQLLEEIEQIPENKIAELYKLVHGFRLSLTTKKPETAVTADRVFNLLTELSDDFMQEGREQLPLQMRDDL
jgi:hypothetical protein